MIKKILIIRIRYVGDAILAMSLCHSLKCSFPNAEIHLVILSRIAPLFLPHPDIDRVISFTDEEYHGLNYVKNVWRVVRSERYDVIIDMISTMKTLLFSLFSLRTPYRIGRYKYYTKLLHNYNIKNPDGANRVQTNIALMAPLEKEGKLVKDESFPLFVTPEEKSSFRQYMINKGINFNLPVIVVAVATRVDGKAWPLVRMKELIRRVLDKYDVQLIFNYSGDKEKTMAQSLYEMLDADSHIFMNIEARDLRQLCALCANSDFFFGNEGGPRHLSQAFEVPSYSIYPPGIDKDFWLPGDHNRYGGFSPEDIVPLEEQKDMTYTERFDLITVDRVWQGLDTMLQRYLNK